MSPTAMIIDDDEALLDALPAALTFGIPQLTVETFNSVEMASARLIARPFDFAKA